MIGEIKYYQAPEKDYRNRFKRGYFYFAPVLFTLGSSLPYLRIDFKDESNPTNTSYTIQIDDSRNLERNTHEPIKQLGLSSDELATIIGCKFRPVIIISPEIPMINSKGTNKCFLVIPLYSTQNEAGVYKYEEGFILRTQAYQYPNLFFLPEDKQFGVKESIARFDKASIIPSTLLNPLPNRLTDDAFFCLFQWFSYLIGGPLDEIIANYRDSAMKKLPTSL